MNIEFGCLKDESEVKINKEERRRSIFGDNKESINSETLHRNKQGDKSPYIVVKCFSVLSFFLSGTHHILYPLHQKISSPTSNPITSFSKACFFNGELHFLHVIPRSPPAFNLTLLQNPHI